MKKTTLLLSMFFGLLIGATAAHSQTLTLSGTVTTPDGLSSDVVSGASIVVTPGNYTATTDAKGKFSMQLPSGVYEITTAGPGYTSYTMDLKMDVSKHVVHSLVPSANPPQPAR